MPRPDAKVGVVTIDVRPIRDEELRDYIDAISTGFLERPEVDKVAEEVRGHWDLNRSWAALEGPAICGTFRSWATELTVPGGACLPAAAVTAVTVLASHRRRGILRSMVAAAHAGSRERGEVAAVLHASEYPIYGRFGYGVGTREATWTLETRSTSLLAEATGEVAIVRADETAREALKAVFEAWRQRQPGELRRRDVMWKDALGLVETGWGKRWQGFVALHKEAGEVDGYARYHVEDKWEQRQPRNLLHLDELHALTDNAYAALWRYLAAMDLVATIKAAARSPSERLPWLLTNARAAIPSEIGDGIWVRLFDIPRALEARSYEVELKGVIEVVDSEADGGRVRLALDAGADGARCRPTRESPDLTVDVAALNAAYLGGTRLRDAVIATGFDEHRQDGLARFDRFFRTADEPWCSTFF
jgi:predicted acetyltransferase